MDLMTRRREMMDCGDTSPKIAEYGKYCSRGKTSLASDPEWCYTEWMVLNPPQSENIIIIVDAYASKGSSYTYQYHNVSGSWGDYWYGNPDFSEYRRVMNTGTNRIHMIRWSIKIENLDRCYAYIETTGQILFAGKNSIYYGHRNISELS